MISTPSLRSRLCRRMLDRMFPDKGADGCTPPRERGGEVVIEDRRVPDRRRRTADRARDGQVARSTSDRRKEPRYVPVHCRARVGWWRGDAWRTADARIENLSRGGAAVFVAEVPPDASAVWLCFLDAPPRQWHAARVVGLDSEGHGARTVRVALAHPLPFCVFTSVVWGARRHDEPGADETTKLIYPPSDAPFAEGTAFACHTPRRHDPPEQIAQYRILASLGAGGMGLVYLAEDAELQRRIALKVMHPHLARDPSGRLRFLREARAAAAIQHDNIVTIFQVGQHDDIPFLAMQLLEGETLAAWLDRVDRPPLNEIVRIGAEIAAGLHAAHRAGLIHRDIKPDNIWLEARDRRVKLLDFGLARTTAQDTSLTHSGSILGTPAYMSPEQATNEACDHRSDLFSLGTVLYRLCGGELPFSGKSAFATLTAVTRHAPRPLDELNPDVPPGLVALIGALLEKRPDDRPADAGVVRAALREIGDDLRAARARSAVLVPA
jgi:tRNA A-37 threonylcarbamoyl transferase component Bud32